MNERSSSVDQTSRVAPVYLVNNGELMIDAPIEKVWHHVIHYTSWQNYPIKQTLSGEPGQEGEVVMLKKDETGFEFPPYYAITIKLEPGRRVVWKTFPKDDTSASEFFGIVDFRVETAGNKTRFSYDSIYEFMVPYRDESELEVYRKEQDRNFKALFAVVFPKLKEVAEQDA
jgi:uncharacterized protein YndB with AHSA1/START domain